MQRRILAMAIVASLGMGLAGCGGDDGGQEAPGVSPTPVPDTPSDPAPSQPSDPQPDPPAEQPGEPDDPPAAGGMAGDCYNPATHAPGNRYRLEYQVSGSFSGVSITDATTGERTDFNGYSAVQTVVDTTTRYVGVPEVQTRVTHYAADVGGNLVEAYGARTEATVMGMTTTTVVRNQPPYRMVKWTLAAGQTEIYSYEGETETTISGAPVPIPPQTSQFSASGSWTYDGRQTVSVPAGTFEACRFTLHTDASTITEWYAPQTGSGVMVKSVTEDPDGSLTLELTLGEFNGVAIGP